MLCAKQTWHSAFFVFVQRVLSKVWHIMCGSCPLLALEFRPAEMGRVLIVLAKSWKKIEIMKKDWNPETLRIYMGTYTQIMKQDWNWNKIEILKQDQFRKNKNSYICVVLSHRFAPQPGPPFFALMIVITTYLATCLSLRLWLLLL